MARARRRMIDPDIWDSHDFASLSFTARLLFIGMFSNADDEGRGIADPAFLKSRVFPYDGELRTTDIEIALSQIARSMSIVLYTHDGTSYYELSHWHDWQTVDRPKPSRFPSPEESEVINESEIVDDASAINRRKIDDASTKRRRLKEKEVEVEKENKNICPSGGLDASFEIFWEAYPRKEKKKDARKRWKILKPNEALLEKILADIEKKRKSHEWMKEGGQYIPQPPAYLNQERWEDEGIDVPVKNHGYEEHQLSDSDLNRMLTNLDE